MPGDELQEKSIQYIQIWNVVR